MRGFTLIEFLIGIAIIAVVFLFSVPFSTSLYKTNQAQIVADEIKNAIQYAKIQAVICNKPVVLTHLQNEKNWSTGMQLIAGTRVLHEWHWHTRGLFVSWQGFQSNDQLLFTPDINRSATNGFFLIKMNAQQQIKLVVNRLGRVK